uniref:IS630 family transposase n=1 Tax=Gongylonema pulchrum TaxID=637853 RepID=A0A183DHD0_9BILA
LVLNTNRKLRMHEVEAFTQTLTRIGRSAAKLKSFFFHFYAAKQFLPY